MWCLETIVKINEKAAELVTQGRSEKEVYTFCGINFSNNEKFIKEFEDQKKKRLKVVG